jgi:hypothetical protein
MVKTKEKAPKLTQKKVIDIVASHTDEEILSLESKDYKLRFSEKDFRELDEATVEGLSKENARDYFVTKGAVAALAKNENRKRAGFGGLQVIEDPFRGKPRSKLEVRGVPKGWTPVWKRPDEVEECKTMGFKLASEGIKTPNATKTATSHVIAAKDGKDDLVLMMVPTRLHIQHLEANAVLSQRRAGATMKEITGLVAKANKHLEDVPDEMNMTETTTIDEVPIAVDMAR